MKDELKSRHRVNFYEAGSGQEEIRVDWFTLLFEVTRVRPQTWSDDFEASLNGATKLILKPRVLADRLNAGGVVAALTQVDARAFRHLNQFSEPAL